MAQEMDAFDYGDFELAKTYIAEHPPEYILCRVGQHRVPDLIVNDIKYDGDGSCTEIRTCERCNAEQHKHFDPMGRSAGTTYKYPEDYQGEKGSGYGLMTRSGRAALAQARRALIEEARARKPDPKPRARARRGVKP